MQYRILGKTDMNVSVVTLGCWALAGDAIWGHQEEQDSLATIHKALDCGINLFDTAEGYGDGYSEEVVGKALKDRRDQAYIATKVSPNHLAANDLVAACEASLKRLQTDYIDLYQLHWPNAEVPFAETMDAVAALQQQGKIRFVGVSNFGVKDLSSVLEAGRVDSNQLAYNLLWRGIEYCIKPLCVRENVGILCYSPLAQGLLTGKFPDLESIPVTRMRTKHFSDDREMARHGGPGYEEETMTAVAAIRRIAKEADVEMGQLALAWLLEQEGVTSVVAGGRKPEQVEANALAASARLTPDVVQALSEATTPLKECFGDDADMWADRIH